MGCMVRWRLDRVRSGPGCLTLLVAICWGYMCGLERRTGITLETPMVSVCYKADNLTYLSAKHLSSYPSKHRVLKAILIVIRIPFVNPHTMVQPTPPTVAMVAVFPVLSTINAIAGTSTSEPTSTPTDSTVPSRTASAPAIHPSTTSPPATSRPSSAPLLATSTTSPPTSSG
jgi:hypothetical protein